MTVRVRAVDPNAEVVLEARREHLARTRAHPVNDRSLYLAELAAGLRVLDVGVVDHSSDRFDSPEWLHRVISRAADYCLGVDILPREVAELQARGFNVRVCDLTQEEPDERFDLVLCGEVIEHLGSPEALLMHGSRCLAPGGRVVITAPNPFYLPRVRDALRGRTSENIDHVTYIFPSGVAELAARAGLRLCRWRGIQAQRPHTSLGRIALALGRTLGGILAEEAWCYSIIYELELGAEGACAR